MDFMDTKNHVRCRLKSAHRTRRGFRGEGGVCVCVCFVLFLTFSFADYKSLQIASLPDSAVARYRESLAYTFMRKVLF